MSVLTQTLLVAQADASEGTKSFTDRLGDFWDDLVDFVPKLLAFLAILIVGWIIAKIVKRVAVAVLKRLRFDEIVDKAGLGGGLAKAGYPDSGVVVGMLLYYAVLLIALQLAITVFGESPVQDMLNSVIATIPRVVVGLIIIVLTGWIANVVRALITPAVSHMAAGPLIGNIVVAAVWVFGVFAAINHIGIAEDIIETMFQVVAASLGLILVIKFGVGGIWAARDRFWPGVYDKLAASAKPAGELGAGEAEKASKKA